MRQAAALVVPVLAMVLTVSGCHGSGKGSSGSSGSGTGFSALPIDPVDEAKVARLRALPFTQSSVDIAVDALREAGVGVYPDGAGGGGEPVRVQQWQVGNLAVEAANGGGVRGSTLTGLGGRPDGTPPVSYLIAAWVTRHPSPAAGFARAVLGAQDWTRAENIVYPKLVLTLFTADLARAATPTGTTTGASGAGRTGGAAWAAGHPSTTVLVPARLLQADGPCTAVSTFIDTAIGDLAALMKVDTSGGGLLGFIGGLWNIAVDLAAGVVRGLVRAFTAAVLAPLIDVFALIGTIDQIVSYLVVWRLVPEKLPAANAFGIAPAIVTGRVEITVSDNQNELPAAVRDCANHVVPGFDKIGSAVDAPVTWTDIPLGRPDLAHRVNADAKVSQQHSASLTYQTGQEPPDATGDLVSETYQVGVAVQRYDLDPLRTLMQRLVTDNLPRPIANVVLALASKVYTAAEALFNDLTSVKAEHINVDISYHDGDRATPSTRRSAGSATPPAPGTATLPTTCPNTAVAEFGFDSIGSQTVDGVLTCFYLRQPSDGELGIGITHQKQTTPPCPGEPIDIPGTDAACFDDDGQHTPGLRVFVSDGGMLIAGGGAGRDELVAIAKRILGIT